MSFKVVIPQARSWIIDIFNHGRIWSYRKLLEILHTSAIFQYKDCLSGIQLHIIKVRWLCDHLIFIMGIMMISIVQHFCIWVRSRNCGYQLIAKPCNKTAAVSWPEPWFNKKMSSYQYRKSHCGDKTILRPSYLHNGISYIGKMTSLYWIGALAHILNTTTTPPPPPR